MDLPAPDRATPTTAIRRGPFPARTDTGCRRPRLASVRVRRWARMRIHMIATEAMKRLGVSSKLNTEWEFFCFLPEEGRRRADEFLATHAEDLGRRSTVDIEQLLSD